MSDNQRSTSICCAMWVGFGLIIIEVFSSQLRRLAHDAREEKFESGKLRFIRFRPNRVRADC
jgi:hypothetical protein